MGFLAELFVKIGADTAGFRRGVSDSKNELTGFGSQLNKTVKSITGFDLKALGAAGAVWKLTKFVMDATNETQAYNLSMIDLAQKMGTSTEEASKLTQVTDDLRISESQLTTAMTFAIRNGVEPSIEGMAALADEYVKLSDPVEKGQLLLRTFGRSGMDMGRLLEQGGDGIKSMSNSIGAGLIVTKEAAEQSKLYYQTVDNLNDSWMSFKMTIGNAVLPILNDVLDGENDTTIATWDNIAALEAGMARQKQYGIATEDTSKEITRMKNELMGGTKWYSNMSVAQAKSIHESIRAASTMSNEAASMRDMAESVRDGTLGLQRLDGVSLEAAYSLQYLYAQSNELREALLGVAGIADNAYNKLNDLSDMDINFSSSIEGSIQSIEWAAAGGREVQAMGDAINTAWEKGVLSESEAIKLSKDLMIVSEQTAVKAGKNFKDAAKSISGSLGVSLSDANGLLKDTDLTLESITGEFNSYVHVWIITHSIAAAPYTSSYGNVETKVAKKLLGGFASGASYVVPPGFENDSWPVSPGHYAKSGERIDIEPRGRPDDSSAELVAVLRNMPNMIAVAVRDQLSRLM